MSATIFDQMEPLSKKDRIVAIMKQSIISGKINAGDPVVENRIAQQMGVGQPLVREALIELEHQGFVQRLPYRGTRVTKLSRADIEQIFNFRVELEPLAIEWAKRNAKTEDVAELKRLADGMKQAARAAEPDLGKFYENDLAFHRKIWEVSGNKYLAEALERVVHPLFAFFWMKTPPEGETLLESAVKHEKVADALLTENAKSLRRLMCNTIGEFKEEWLTKLLPED